MKKTILLMISAFLFSLYSCLAANGSGQKEKEPASVDPAAGLKLPAGFTAVKAVDSTGRARHLAVTRQGGIYVKLDRLKDGKSILYLQDTDGDGIADKETGFGDYRGTGVYIKDNFLYASSDEDIFRYRLDDKGGVINPDKPEKIVTGLVNRRQHASKSIVLDNVGNIYVNIGAYSNVCQEKDRVQGSPGMKDCPILDSAGGIWQFKADKLNQSYSDGVRYATGLRNVVGLDWNDQADALFVMQHGRDQLQQYTDIYPDKETVIQLPAECMYMVKKGDDAGWPYIYYDQFQKKKILNPEYGGDGKKEGKPNAIDPVMAFPGHLAPNGLLFYTGKMFPEKYRNGAFIAFHGSWNRAPQQAGYYVAFVPFKDGKPSGNWEVFADGFAGTAEVKSPKDAAHRPCGLAQGPDGSLYVSDSVKGAVYKISYKAD